MKRVLVVEDESIISEIITTFLLNNEIIPVVAPNAEIAESYLNREEFDMALVDVNLSECGQDGFLLLKKLRQDAKLRQMPIIFLTKRDSISDRIKGLELGADDYITKPFDCGELLARMNAVLRRSVQSKNNDFSEALVLEYGLIKIDILKREVYAGGEQVRLTAREFDLMQLLLSNVGRLFTRAELEETIWREVSVDGSRLIDQHVKNLKKKLRQAHEGAENLIISVRGLGYKIE